MITTTLYGNYMRIDIYHPRASVLCILLMGTLAAQAQAENMGTILDIHHILGYLGALFLITVFVMMFYNRLFYFKDKDVTKETQRLNAQLGLIMDANRMKAWTYDMDKRLYKVLTEYGTKEIEYTPIDFSQFFDRDDFEAMRKLITDIQDGKTDSETLLVKSAPLKNNAEEQHIYEINISILRHHKNGRPKTLLGTQCDITEEQEKAENTRKLMLRYHTVFESSLVDMVFYDANGILTELNNKAMETFGVTNKQAILDQKVRIWDVPSYREIDIHAIDAPMHFSSITDISKVKETDERIPQILTKGKIYYEADLSAVRDKNQKLLGVIAAGRSITDMVESNHHQKEAAALLEKQTKAIQNYIEDINYSLKISHVRLMHYHPEKHELDILSDPNHIEYSLSQIRAMSMIDPEDRAKAYRMLLQMDKRHKGDFSETLHTIFKDKEGRDIYLNFRIMPIYNQDGEVSYYLGMCRDDTEVTHTEIRLKKETAKAQEAEQVKSTFLLNMSYELRTPLNAVIGFAELFGTEHNEEDEPLFAEEIKKNTNTLLRLINDILFLSRLDAKMIEYNYLETDFALQFEGWCYMGWSNLSPCVKTVIENPYNKLLVKIDPQNLAMVIQKLCIYSGLTTTEGTVRAKYEYRRGELMITIEDTGEGMDAENLEKAFDRFVHEEGKKSKGTGLDLPIVKELVEQMNGTIELQSEQGKGSTFFVSIPCEMINFEKKRSS